MSEAESGAQAFGPYAITLSPAETEAAAARFGLRLALEGGLTARHHAPLAAFALALVFASILGFTDLITRRAAEIVILLAAALFMMQRLATHWRLRTARARGKAALNAAPGPVLVTLDATGVTVEGGHEPRRLSYAEFTEAEDAGGVVYLWPKAGAPVVLPTRTLTEGEAPRLVAEARRRIAAARGAP